MLHWIIINLMTFPETNNAALDNEFNDIPWSNQWDGMLVCQRVTPPALNSPEPIYMPGCETESKARVWTQPTHARVKSTNHEVTMPSTIAEAMLVCNGNRDLSIMFTGMPDASENIDIVKHLHILILLAFTQLEF